jgi:2-polyprenyl-6-methoxyphenol hydroxylase-like FAD-dependent oxidoreductase
VIRAVIVGGGVVGLALAKMLHHRGVEPIVLERAAAGWYQPRGFMLGYQGYPVLQDIGVFEEVRDAGWDIAPGPDGTPVSICVEVGKLIEALARDLPVAHEEQVIDLVRDGDRVVGVVSEGPGGRVELESDLVVACDGMGSKVRELAGLESRLIEVEDAYMGFMSPAVIDRPFAMGYLTDGGQIGLLGWPEGSAGWRSVQRVGVEAAKAPGLDAFKQAFAALLPESAEAVEALTSFDQVRYSEPRVLRCPTWWTEGVVLIGDSAHFFGPETGASAGLGLGDAQALAEAIRQNPDSPDDACRAYVTWREPVIRPYEAMDPAGQRPPLPDDYVRPPAEAWPPVG